MIDPQPVDYSSYQPPTLPVMSDDPGIRPAGKPDQCFYCGRKVGESHKQDCVILKRAVKVRYTFEIEIDMPFAWDAGMIDFHRNDSSWCASNAVGDIEKFMERQEASCGSTCICNNFKSEYLGETDGAMKYSEN